MSFATLATVNTSTRTAPARFNVRAISFIVEPVV